MFRLVARFPYTEVFDGDESAQLRALGACMIEVFEGARNRCTEPVFGAVSCSTAMLFSSHALDFFIQLCKATAHMFSALLGDRCRQWYFHVLSAHVAEELAVVDLWSLSAATGEARQRIQVC